MYLWDGVVIVKTFFNSPTLFITVIIPFWMCGSGSTGGNVHYFAKSQN